MPNLLNPLPVESELNLPLPSINNSLLSGNIDGSLSWTDQNTLLYNPINNVIYVTKNGNDSNTGKSLIFAKASIKSALTVATAGTTIIVASGVYTEQNPLICPPNVVVTAQDSLVQIKPKNNADVFYLNNGTVINGIAVVDHRTLKAAFKMLSNTTVTKLPVIKNCSIFSDNGGDGIVIDGLDFNSESIEKSIIVENCDITVSNKIGILSKNSACAYVTNCVTRFCNIGYHSENGGKLVLNSCSNFYGNYGLSSIGFNSVELDTGIVAQNESSSVTGITVDPNLYSFETIPVITIDPPFPTDILVAVWSPNTEIIVDLDNYYISNGDGNIYNVVSSGITGDNPPSHTRGIELNGTCLFQYVGSTAIAIPIMKDNFLTGIEITDSGGGYTSVPNVYFNNELANVSVELSYVNRVKVSNLTKQPIANDLIEIGDQKYQIYFATKLTDGISDISIISTLVSINSYTPVTFYDASEITAINHQFNYVGSGIDINALPKNNGYSTSDAQIIKSNFGTIHYSSNDVYSGISKIGDIFEINQITGAVTATPTSKSLVNIAAIGPFLRNGVASGVVLKEVSANENLISSTGFRDSYTVPTQTAIASYLQNNYVSNNGDIINGKLTIQDVVIENNLITTVDENQNLIISPNGNGKIDINFSNIVNLAQPIEDNDAATKKFVVDLVQGGITIPSVIPIIWGSEDPNGSLILRSTKSVDKPTAGIILDDNIDSTSVTTGTLVVNGGVGINGALNATTKSFDIKHPLDSNKRLCYGSLESPYHGIRLTGKSVTQYGVCTVKLPDYIAKLVKETDINIQLTNLKHDKVLWVDEVDIKNNEFIIKSNCSEIDCYFYWSFTAVRADVEDLVVEYTNERS